MRRATILPMRLYTLIFAFVLGIILTVFTYQAFTIYQLRSVVERNSADLANVVNFLNTQIQAAQQANGKSPATAAPASASTPVKK